MSRKGKVSSEPREPCAHELLPHCLAGNFKGLCKQIDHFPEDADYEADTAEYFLRESHGVLISLPAEGPLSSVPSENQRSGLFRTLATPEGGETAANS